MEKETNRLSIGRINGVEIYAVKSDDGSILVPVKPICAALGVDDRAQREKINDDEDLRSVGVLSTSTGADGKSYEMLCLPEKFIYGWIFTINPKNVSAAARESVRMYRRKCYTVLYDYFNGKSQRQQDLLDAERQAVARLTALEEQIAESDSRIKELKAERAKARYDIDQIRASRLDEQPTLFD
ncbi:MAG: chromosome partitioning protein ParA [Bacteroides sp.]|nr:chromosome partitioning protein ParA [Bacteroides sp.]